MENEPSPPARGWVADVLALIRGAVRPLVTVMVVGTFLAFLGMEKFEAAQEIFEPLVLLVVTFWFVDRTLRAHK